MQVSEAVATRRSVRAFQDKPVDLAVLRRVLDRAQMAPSGCNFQPWLATVLAGEPLRRLQEKMLAAQPQDPIEYDFSAPQQSPAHLDRLRSLGAAMYGSMQVAREDKGKRMDIAQQNLVSFGAPALLVCYFERFMAPPQWADVGMWLQTIMLLLREEGLDSCPQEWMALYARLIKAEIGVPDESHILFCGLAIGYREAEAPVNNFERSRLPLDEAVRFVGFDQ
ncbi:nitroreductase [Novosphingobium sp. JCM 18896]|uniref:nitroreductase n=1 Tax=Novosphingobium sp. JCM 18896 TaxID=2989731 RepID=UPI0022232DA3|nr:nitroreductase [Novosphingobium sp. JCM 18896]MCW1427954.1 nitroreductase [Novosphingobium sp. JCM 18896]